MQRHLHSLIVGRWRYVNLARCQMSGQPSAERDDGRESEFVRLLTEHQQDIYLYLRSLILDPDETSEVVQDVNLVLWGKRDQFRLGTNFRAWAFKIARYKLLQSRAKRQRACPCFSDVLVDELAIQAADCDAVLSSMLDDMRRCIAKLPPEDRELITRRYEPQASCASVARGVNHSIRWVYKAVSRIRKALMGCILREMSARRDQ